MKIQLLDRAKKKKIIEALNYLGIQKIPQLILKSGRERLRAYSGHLSNEEIMELWRLLPIEGIGLYVGKEMIDRHGVREVRASIDGLHEWKEQITKNIVELDEEEEKTWFLGKNVERKDEEHKGAFVAVRSKGSEDIIGMGKVGVDGKTLYNFLPKERRRKSQTI